MAKAQAKKGPASGHIPRLISYLQQGSVSPTIVERYTRAEWVSFGRDNLWPQKLLTLVENCGPLTRCVTTLASLIAGGGIRFYNKNGDEIEEARDFLNNVLLEDTTEEDFLNAVAYDIAVLNAGCMVARRSATADVVRIDHLDVSRLRSGHLDEETGRPSNFWFSTNWARRYQGDRYKPKELGVYGDDERTEKDVIYSRAYHPGSVGDVYAVPWWTGAIVAAEVWTKIDAYNKGQIDTGFTPSVHLHTFTTKDDSELDDYDEKVMEAYSGAMGRGIMHTYSSPGEGMAPLLTVLPRGNHAGELDEIRDNCEKVIFNAYGMPPILMGMDTNTGLDGTGSAIQQAQLQVDKMLVKPKQQLITKALTKVLNDAGMTDVWMGKIDSVSLSDPLSDVKILQEGFMASVTKNEFRENNLQMDPIEEPTFNEPIKASRTNTTTT